MVGEERPDEEKALEELEDGENDQKESTSEDDGDEDDEAELLAELEKIKRERAAERERKLEEEEKARQEKIIQGNPLLVPSQSGKSASKFSSEVQFAVKRRWNDDVVFKNCTRGMDDRAKKPRFINDSLRSDFHRRFMDKYFQ